MSIPNHIEVSTDHPRSVVGRRDGAEFVKELGPELRNRRSINIGDVKGEVGDSRGKVNRQGMSSRVRADESKGGVCPGRKNAPGCTVRRVVAETVKAPGKKRSKFAVRDLGKLGFLEEDKIVTGGEQFHEDIATLVMVTQPTHIPTAD